MIFIKEYWTQIIFLGGTLSFFLAFGIAMIEGVKCSLRNDVLTIYDRCKDNKKITHYELEAIQHSAELYFKLKGNSFVKDIVERTKDFELVD